MHSALIDYVNNNGVNNIVLGASTRSVITRYVRTPVSYFSIQCMSSVYLSADTKTNYIARAGCGCQMFRP